MMRKISIAVISVACVFSVQASFASTSTPIHFIYAKPGVTSDQFQGDRNICARDAKRLRLNPLGAGEWQERQYPSSTVFLNCMADKGYALSKNGWDTGVLWILPYRPAH